MCKSMPSRYFDFILLFIIFKAHGLTRQIPNANFVMKVSPTVHNVIQMKIALNAKQTIIF